MKLRKKVAALEPVTGRRRPLPATTDQPRVNPAFSYHAQRSAHDANTGRLDSAEVQQRDSGAADSFVARNRLLLRGLAIIVLLAGLYYTLLSSSPNIILKKDDATAYFLQDSSVYRQTAAQALSASIFNRSKLTIDTTAVRLSLLKSYPEIKNVTITLPLLGHQPQVLIEPYKPSYILTTTSGNAYVLDETGRAMAPTTQVGDIDKLQLQTLQDKTGVAIKQGSPAIPSTTVSFVQTVVAALQAKHVTFAALTLPPAAYELDVTIGGAAPYYIKFNLQGDALLQAGTYLATKGRLESDRIKPIQYIDVRIPERAYYK